MAALAEAVNMLNTAHWLPPLSHPPTLSYPRYALTVST